MDLRIKKVNNQLIALDKFNNLFELDCLGTWQQLSSKQIFDLLN